MKSNNPNHRLMRQHGYIEIPSWVVWWTIYTATMAVCLMVVVRTYGSLSEAKIQYREGISEIESTLEVNIPMLAQVSRLRAGGVVVIETGQELASATSNITKSGPAGAASQGPTLLSLLLYCFMAAGSGFGAVRTFITLYRRVKVRRRPSSEEGDGSIGQELLFLAFFSVLAIGFFYAIDQQFKAVGYRYKTENLSLEREKLLVEQQEMKLELYEYAKSGKLIIMSSASPGHLIPPLTDAPSSYSSSFSASSSLVSPSIMWGMLSILGLLGGVLGVLSVRVAESSSSIGKAPGAKLHSIVHFLYSPKTVKETFEPIIADWRLEYFESLSQKKIWKSRWICVRYTYSFIMAMGLSKMFSFYKVFTRAGK